VKDEGGNVLPHKESRGQHLADIHHFERPLSCFAARIDHTKHLRESPRKLVSWLVFGAFHYKMPAAAALTTGASSFERGNSSLLN
jgi:hypothetical protein